MSNIWATFQEEQQKNKMNDIEVKEIVTMHRGEKFLHASVGVYEIKKKPSFLRKYLGYCFGENIEYKEYKVVKVYSPSKFPEDARWYYSDTAKDASEITTFIFDHFKVNAAEADAKNVKEIIL